jgi:hypothetical protein
MPRTADPLVRHRRAAHAAISAGLITAAALICGCTQPTPADPPIQVGAA